jgi:hypothetical protein
VHGLRTILQVLQARRASAQMNAEHLRARSFRPNPDSAICEPARSFTTSSRRESIDLAEEEKHE